MAKKRSDSVDAFADAGEELEQDELVAAAQFGRQVQQSFQESSVPPQEGKPVVPATAVATSPALVGPLRRWRVSLADNPDFEVEAADEAGAVAAYKKRAGIRNTIHRILAKPLD